MSLPNGWSQIKFGECFRVKHGFAFKGAFFANSGPYILLTPGNFDERGGLKERDEREKFYTAAFPNEFLLKKGDLLVVMTDLTQSAPILGSPAIVPVSDKYLHNQRLGKIIDLDESSIYKPFLYHLFNSANVRSQIKASATGSTVRHTAPERIYAIQLLVPPLAAQRRIADILSAYDDLIENNFRRIKILEDTAQMLYRGWFVSFRFPGHENVRMVESELGPIPEGWTTGILRDVCESVEYGHTASACERPIGPKFLRITDIVPQTIHWENVPFCPVPDKNPDKYALREGDIVVARTGATTGYAKRLNKRHPNSVFASYLVRLRMKQNFSNHVFGILIQSDDYKRFIKANWSGAAQPQANAQILTLMPVVLPPSNLQFQFSTLVEPLVDLSENLQVKNRNLRTTRDLLLPKLISGEIPVEAAEDTAAELVEQTA